MRVKGTPVRRLLLALSAIAMAYACGANADDRLTVGEFYFNCKAARSTTHWATCANYMMGYADSLNLIGMMGESLGTTDRIGICDASYTSDSLAFLFINWAEQNPKCWTKDFVLGVDQSLKDAWPCKWSGPGTPLPCTQP
jgi:hypothetical protein